MSSESLVVAPAKKSRPRPPLPLVLAPALLDVVLIVAFLALTFLLGVFPLKDTDFWWHLRTGDWIRQTGWPPTHDLYTFTVPDHPWIDLHWGFQVAISWGYAHGGVVALNLAKCAITCAAVFLLVTARRRDWPLWVSLLAWLPALLVLGGRMYIRPETLTLLYLAIDLAILFRWERFPLLALLLPVVQVAWVNSHGLFVLGPILLTCALIDALLRPGALAPGRKRWWWIVALATVLTGLACLVNPYGVRGALFPLELARTMGNPMFAQHVAELMPVPVFIERNGGWRSLPLLLHVATMVLGALSFLIPLVWTLATRLRRPPADPAAKPARKIAGKAGAESYRDAPAWRLSLFRLLLFAAFSALSWQATRNSHQFAAVVGTVTAWNFGEWAAAARRRRRRAWLQPPPPEDCPRWSCSPAWVRSAASPSSLSWSPAASSTPGPARDGRSGLVRSRSGSPTRPSSTPAARGCRRTVPQLPQWPRRALRVPQRPEAQGLRRCAARGDRCRSFTRYLKLSSGSGRQAGLGPRARRGAGRPDPRPATAQRGPWPASIMANPGHWRCVWFDPIVALFVHRSYTSAVAAHGVDLGARHFAPDPATDPHGLPRGLARLGRRPSGSMPRLPPVARAAGPGAAARAARSRSRPSRPACRSRRARRLEAPRQAGDGPRADRPRWAAGARYRLPFDPVYDLSAVRATYDLRRAHEITPRRLPVLYLLEL